jgi:Protein of unknown function (DUF2917)
MQRTLNLAPNRFAHLDGAACLRVTQGRLWLTIDGEPDDRVLEAGDRIALPPKAHALAQALGAPTIFTVQPRVPARLDLRAALRRWARAVLPDSRTWRALLHRRGALL